MSLGNMDKFRIFLIILLCVLVYECYGLNCRSGNDNKELELQRVYAVCQKRFNKEKINSSRIDSSTEWYPTPSYRRTTNFKYEGNQDSREDNERKYGLEFDGESQWRRNEKNMNDMRSMQDRFYSEKTDSFAAPVEERVIDRPGHSYPGNEENKNTYGFIDGYRMKEGGDTEVANFEGSRRTRLDLDTEGGSKFYIRNDEMIPARSTRDKDRNLRFKRSRPERNSGSRTQYNPNISKKSLTFFEDAGNEDSLNKSNASNAMKKACSLHCYLENLGMTSADGLPDKYLVTHVLTKDITSEDLKDFLVESIEECFQILENENMQEKCEFSKSLLLCLSEKGKANCDDWRDDLSFKVASHRINNMMTN